MAGITSTGSSTRVLQSATNAPGLSEAELAKNLKLIESTANEALKLIEAQLKQASAQPASTTKTPDGSAFVTSQQAPADTQQGATTNGAFPSEAPKWEAQMRPADKLKVDNNGVITTPGGYKIEQLGTQEWKISGPDGKSTRIWGDPHVDESDGGKFDFKRDTTFVLGDGTQIHVGTVPYGNGMTVTGKLDITCGDDHIQVTDIDKGKGKVGTIQKDGWEVSADFTTKHFEDRLNMGDSTASWSYGGREVTGNDGTVDKFKTGDFMTLSEKAISSSDGKTSSATFNKATFDTTRDNALTKATESVTRTFNALGNTQSLGFNPFTGKDDLGKYDKDEHAKAITKAFDSVKTMFSALDDVGRLNDMVKRNLFV
ncbi:MULTISPECIES: DUF1521 domain-containing protein [Corallococcus]|uniref:DUF1521 domain-containing protein n=1 Tax=Corallococcus TaxID=83461 RepID=UPI001F2604EA|nr:MULTISPECIES: DUF1521 domain-containing protein [Corallococcus]